MPESRFYSATPLGVFAALLAAVGLVPVANLLSGGRFLRAEGHREFFSSFGVLDDNGRWFSQFPIGGPLVIAVGMALGAPWLVNPLLAGLTARNLYRFFSRAYDDLTARLATFLFAASPFVLIMSASELNHVATLALATLALAELPTWMEATDNRVRRRGAVVIGLAIGGAVAVRPLDGAVVALVIAVLQLHAARSSSARWRSLAWQVAAGAIPVALVLWTNARIT